MDAIVFGIFFCVIILNLTVVAALVWTASALKSITVSVNLKQEFPEGTQMSDPYDEKGDPKNEDEDLPSMDDILRELHAYMSEE